MMGGVPAIEFLIRFFVWLATAGVVLAFILAVLENRNEERRRNKDRRRS
jgi:preprotein translocase subunit SecG